MFEKTLLKDPSVMKSTLLLVFVVLNAVPTARSESNSVNSNCSFRAWDVYDSKRTIFSCPKISDINTNIHIFSEDITFCNKVISGVLQNIVAIFGVASNILSIYIYSRPNMKTPINFILLGNTHLINIFTVLHECLSRF